MENQEKVISLSQVKTQKDLASAEMPIKNSDEAILSGSKEFFDFFNNKIANLQNTVESRNQQIEDQNQKIENQNQKMDAQNEKMDKLIEFSSTLINEIRKQTIDETRPACKISRDLLRDDVITVASLNRHLDFYIFTGHIAELFEMLTKDKKKFSSQSASMMLDELGIKNDNNFSYKDSSSKINKVRKYSYDVFEEVVSRLKNPEKYNLSIEVTAKWITKCKLPSQGQIEEYRNNIKKEL